MSRLMNVSRAPVLWSLSNRSGSLFQKPLFAALNLEGDALAVCSPASVALSDFNERGKLLMAPPTLDRLTSMPSFLAAAPVARYQLKQLLRKKAELVHVTMGSPIDAFYLAAAKSAAIPVVMTIHDNARHLGEGSRILDVLDRLTLRYVDHVVTVSDFVFDEVQRNIKNKPVHVVSDGLLTRDQQGLPPRATMHVPARILFLGRIHEYKGLEMLLQSLDILDGKGASTALTIAGSGDLEPYAAALAKRPQTRIINHWIDDATILELLKEQDILALPYLEASQSGIAIDAQWAAMPAVATPVGALPQQFSAGKAALICSDVSAEAFAASLLELLNSQGLYSTLSKGAYNAYRDKDLITVARKWRDFYASLDMAKGQE
jgi:glycosyltransferase involved in cell wall biosynthesis